MNNYSKKGFPKLFWPMALILFLVGNIVCRRAIENIEYEIQNWEKIRAIDEQARNYILNKPGSSSIRNAMK